MADLVPVDGHGSWLLTEPIIIGGFKLGPRSATPVGRPTLEGWVQAFRFAFELSQASPYWPADLLRYAATREEWAERIEQVLDLTGWQRQTLLNYSSILKRVAPEERMLAPSIGHLDVVAAMAPDEQREWLERSRNENLTVRELRVKVRASRRQAVLEGQAALEGMYRVIYADPPWSYGDSGPTVDGSLGKAERHYTGMSIDDIAALPVEAHALPNSVLFLWVTASHLYQVPGPRDVMQAWGFSYKTNIVWDKVLGMPGHYTHVTHEHLLLCTRGSCLPDEPLPQPKSVQTYRRTDQHSEKPEEFRQLIDRLYPIGPRVELFARSRAEGWDAFGNDARLWGEEARRFA